MIQTFTTYAEILKTVVNMASTNCWELSKVVKANRIADLFPAIVNAPKVYPATVKIKTHRNARNNDHFVIIGKSITIARLPKVPTIKTPGL
jgi:hypothetical protein